MHKYGRHLLRCVCYKNDIHRRDSLRHRRVCLRVVRARATVSGARGARPPAPPQRRRRRQIYRHRRRCRRRQRPTDNRFVPKATPCVDRTPVGPAAPSDKLVCRHAFPSDWPSRRVQHHNDVVKTY